MVVWLVMFWCRWLWWEWLSIWCLVGLYSCWVIGSIEMELMDCSVCWVGLRLWILMFGLLNGIGRIWCSM